MQAVLLIIQKERLFDFNTFVSTLRKQYGTSLIEVDNYSDVTMQNFAAEAINATEEPIKVYFYAEEDISPGSVVKLVQVLSKQKRRIEDVVFKGENRFFKQFKTVLQP